MFPTSEVGMDPKLQAETEVLLMSDVGIFEYLLVCSNL